MHRRQYQRGSIRKKNGKWTLRYRDYLYGENGKLETVSRTRVLLPASRTKSEARRAADQFMAKLGSGSGRPRQPVTFLDFWERHFVPNVIANLKPSTVALYGTLARVHLMPVFGGELLTDITRLDVQRFINSKRIAGYSPKTLTHFRNLLSKAFGSAVRWDMIQASPASNIELPPMASVRKVRVLTPEEISTLEANLSEPTSTIFITGVLLGLRIGELLALQAGDIDLLEPHILIKRDIYRGSVGTPKTAASVRVLPIPKVLLHRYTVHCQGKKPEDWLFPNASGFPLDDRNLIRREVEPVCSDLEMPRFSWHSLRHTFSTYCGNNGIAMPVLQSLLGHTSADMTMRYTHPLESAKKQAIEQLASQLWPTVAQNGQTNAKATEAINLK